MEITEAMLDSFEAVKGKRNPGLWDHRCATHFALKGKTASKPAVKANDKS